MAIGYVTVAEADEYIYARYLYTDWDALDDESKAALLLRSVEAIETLPFQGRKALPTQPWSFPRESGVVPQAVKAAQIENAFQLLDTDSEADAAFYSKLRLYGVYRYSIGNLSETIRGGSASSAVELVSAKALNLLEPFLRGGYRVV